MLIESKITEFLDDLAGKSSTPGGGSAAALVGACAAALVSMVFNFTIGKKGYESVQDRVKELLTESERLRAEFTKLIDLDAGAFDKIMAAYKLPKSNDEEKSSRKTAIQAATKEAASVPFKTAELSVELLSLAMESAEIGNKNVVSDAAVAASLAYSSMESAWVNVEINLKSITDDDFVDNMRERGEILMAEGDELYESTLEVAGNIILG